MDVQTLFEMTSAAARNAERNCQPGREGGGFDYGGYPAYIAEYNNILPLVWGLCGKEAEELFKPLNIGKALNPADALVPMWKTYAELAAARLSSLAAYLKTRQGTKVREQTEVHEIVEANLRAALYSDPSNERDVQDILETIFRVRGLSFRREQDAVPYSVKRYVPDFTFDALGLAVEVKICPSSDRERRMVDEINADIIGYGPAYEKILFVIYDLGYIRDVARFRADIEQNAGVSVLIVKK